MMNKNLSNGVIKSSPKKWSGDEINNLKKLKDSGLHIEEIAKKLNRTKTSVQIKWKRLHKKENAYNKKHRREKYLVNEMFVKEINPSSILDVYAAKSFYKNNSICKNIKVIDNDKDSNFMCDFNLNAIELLHKFRNRKFDLVDLDPYGSAFDCFDYALQIAQKGIVITFGEVGHKRWKRCDFVKDRYNINTIEDFKSDKFSNYIIKRGLIFKKNITTKYVCNFRNILRVYFLINKIEKKRASGIEYFE